MADENSALPAPDISPEILAQLNQLQAPPVSEPVPSKIPQNLEPTAPFNPNQFNMKDWLLGDAQSGQRAVQQVEPPQQPSGVPAREEITDPRASQPSTPPQAPQMPSTEGYNMQQKAALAIGNFQANKANALADEYQKQQEALIQRQTDLQQKMAEVNNNVDKELGALKTMGEDLRDFEFKSPEITVNSPFTNGTTGQKIMAAIAIALGGIGGALTGKGDNKGLEVINAAIERDLQTQRDNAKMQLETQARKFEARKAGVSAQQSLLGVLNQKFGNELQAEAAYGALATQAAQNKLMSVSAKYEAPELQAKAQLLNGQLEQQKLEHLAKFQQAGQMKQVMQLIGKKFESGEGVSDSEIAMYPKEVQEYVLNLRDRFVPGMGMASADKAAVTEFRKYMNETGPALTNAKEIFEIGKKLKLSSKLPGKTKEVLNSRLTVLAGQLRLPVTGPGSMQQAEYERLRDAIGDPTKIGSLQSWELAKLKTVIDWLEGNINERAQQVGLRPAKPLHKPVK